MSDHELDIAPEAIVGSLYALVSLMQAWKGPGPLERAAVREALGPYEVDPAGPEARALESLETRLKRMVAVNLATTTRELELVLADAGAADAARTAQLKVARQRIQGSLKIVRKMSPQGLAGQLEAIFEEFGGGD